MTAKATRPGEVPLEWEDEAAVEVVAAAGNVVEAVDVETILAVLEETELEELVVLGAARLGKELEDTDVSEVVASFDVFVDFVDFVDFEDFELELLLESGEGVVAGVGAAGVGVALLLSSVPSGIVAVTGPKANVIALS